MNEIMKRPEPMMPIIPEVLKDVMPVQLPQLEYGANPIKKLTHNWSLKRLNVAADMEANISEHKTRQVKAKLEGIKSIMTFSSEVHMIFKRHDHESKMMEFQQQLIQAEIKMKGFEEQKVQAEIEQTRMKTRKMYVESQLDDLDLKRRVKEWENEYGPLAD